VEWQTLLSGALGSSPLALVLGFACWKLWARNEAKDLELKALNDKMVAMLLEVAHKE
jgi:hypothetical protein